MKKRNLIVVTLFILLIMPLCSAYISLDIYIQEDGSSRFVGFSEQELELPSGIEYDHGKISGTTHELTSKQAEIWGFDIIIEDLSEISVHLPQGASITEIASGSVYSINNELIVSSQGDEVVISFNYVIGEVETEESKSWINYIAGILILIALLIIVKRIVKGRAKSVKQTNISTKKNSITKQKKLDIIKKTLSEREKLIIEKVQEVGKIKHSRLQRLCEIPKASFSRHIQELEKKGIVRREGEGKNKIVSLR